SGAAGREAAPGGGGWGLGRCFTLPAPPPTPAGVGRRVMGVWDRRWVRPVAEVLARLGAERAWVVHGAGGLDELSLEGETVVAEVVRGGIRERSVRPDGAGLTTATTRTHRGAWAAGAA